MRTPDKDRRDWIIVLVIILIGLILILLAGGCAVRLKPGWRLDSNMGSRIDPDSIFLTHRPNILFEPIDSSILTKPAWANDGLYITPGAEIRTGTPAPAVINNNTLPAPVTITAVPTTPTLVYAVTPTNTSGSLPPPAPTRTFTPVPVTQPTANLSIVVSDAATTYIVGGTVTYTITVTNPAGSANVNGATVMDTFPAALSGITWTCTGLNGATCPANGSGNINASVNLPAGSSVTFTVTANISPAATVNLVNTATVSVPAGITDPSLLNNTATDTDTPVFRVDLQITKTDGIAVYTPGTSVTYTITVFNAGPANATGATVGDNFPAEITGVSWTCTATGGAACPAANGNGNINQTVNIPRNGRLTYTAIASTSPFAAVDLVNTANVGAPAGYTETVPGDNSDTDTDTVFIPTANISITKTDGSLTYTPGNPITYTITATNAGPDAATGITITDTFDTIRLRNITWICAAGGGATCTGSGSGNISDTVSLPASGTVTYTVSADVRSNATNNLVNTAQAGIPANVNDPDTSNNSATDTDTPNDVADLRITNTDNATEYVAGAVKTYTITVFNDGPSNVSGATVTGVLSTNADIDPASIAWCSPAPSCTPSTIGDINQTVNLTAGSSITYLMSAQIVASPTGPSISNTATVTAPVGVTDAAGNNLATDTDDLMVPESFPPDLGSGPAPTGDPYYNLPDGGTLTLLLPTPVTVGSHAGWDITYFEREIFNNIFMDQVIIEIGDGSNWYIVLYWGDGFSDANTNIAIPLSGNSGGTCTGEPDNCVIDGPLLAVESGYITGITIDVDLVSPAIPNGTYNYLRIREPGLGSSDSINIDGIYIWP